MSDKLRDALDHIQDKLDAGELIDYTDSEDLQLVLEAADRYWEDRYNKGYDGY